MSLSGEIARWLAERVREAGADGVVFGMSGGVDSSVVAGLSAKALGEKAMGLIMPCHSGAEDEEFAREAAEKFGVKTERYDLSGVYDSLLSLLPPVGAMPKANIKPRLRMMVLYNRAAELRRLVVGSSNLSETMAGYFTKWGDACADIQPLAKLSKTKVCELAKELGVPQPIVERAPSAGLWDGQTDEEEMGVSYAELDAALEILAGKAPEGSLSPEVMEKVKALVARSEHKRKAPPVYPYQPGGREPVGKAK